LIERIQSRVPGIALRTTLIVGYPEEAEKEFSELLEFVRDARFDRLGVFEYSREQGTTAYGLGDPVPRKEKERRRSLIMEVQQAISMEKNEQLINTTQRVLLERQEGSMYVGRTERDAPEIDNEVYVRSSESLQLGEFVDVDIEDASEYDLLGTIH